MIKFKDLFASDGGGVLAIGSLFYVILIVLGTCMVSDQIGVHAGLLSLLITILTYELAFKHMKQAYPRWMEDVRTFLIIIVAGNLLWTWVIEPVERVNVHKSILQDNVHKWGLWATLAAFVIYTVSTMIYRHKWTYWKQASGVEFVLYVVLSAYTIAILLVSMTALSWATYAVVLLSMLYLLGMSAVLMSMITVIPIMWELPSTIRHLTRLSAIADAIGPGVRHYDLTIPRKKLKLFYTSEQVFAPTALPDDLVPVTQAIVTLVQWMAPKTSASYMVPIVCSALPSLETIERINNLYTAVEQSHDTNPPILFRYLHASDVQTWLQYLYCGTSFSEALYWLKAQADLRQAEATKS